MINPDLPLDEQTEALAYDIGWEFPISNLKMGMLLGQGAFGRVLKAEAVNIESDTDCSTVAVKTVRGEHLQQYSHERKLKYHVIAFENHCGLWQGNW